MDPLTDPCAHPPMDARAKPLEPVVAKPFRLVRRELPYLPPERPEKRRVEPSPKMVSRPEIVTERVRPSLAQVPID